MPKAKSALTLAKEEKIKEKIKEYEKGYDSLTLAGVIPSIKWQGKLLKSSYPDVLIRKGVLNMKLAGGLRGIQKILPTHVTCTYVLGLSFVDKSIAVSNTMYHKMSWSLGSNGSITLHHMNTAVDAWLASQVLTDWAVAIEWPDELGKTKIHMHKDSRMAYRMLNTVQAAKPDGLNRNAIQTVTSWSVLKDYLIGRSTGFGWEPQQKAICDLVKAVSTHHADMKIQELVAVGG